MVEQNGIIQYTGGVDHPFEGQRSRRNLGKKGAHGDFISHIDLGDLDGNAVGRQLVNGLLLGGVGHPTAPHEDQLSSPLCRQPGGDDQPQRA